MGTMCAVHKLSLISLFQEEEVPLRVLLVLLDEVFDLRDQGQWLRRQLTILLKQLAGDKLSRKVVETIDWLTSPEQVAEYIRDLRYIMPLPLKNRARVCFLSAATHSGRGGIRCLRSHPPQKVQGP